MKEADKLVSWGATLFLLAAALPFLVRLSPNLFHEKGKITPPKIAKEVVVIDGIEVESGLKFDEGYEIVRDQCSKCHSLELVTQNRASRSGWEENIRWMQETQGLWDLGELEGPILDYLAKNYGPKKSSRRPNLENIEWYEY